MGKKLGAFIAFNVYSLFLISAFQQNTPYLFDIDLISRMHLSGISIYPEDLGWNDHYIWRLISGTVTTAIAGVLAGAIAKQSGSKVAAVSNIPSVIMWLVQIYLFRFTDVKIVGQTGFVLVSIIAIPLTTYVAYFSGSIGETLQADEFDDKTILGIKPYHWIWALFPLYLYALGIIFVVAKFIAFQIATWGDASIVGAFMSLLALAPIVAWVYPLRLVHRVLMGELLVTQHAAVRGFANFGILTLGTAVATGIQFISFWLLTKMIK